MSDDIISDEDLNTLERVERLVISAQLDSTNTLELATEAQTHLDRLVLKLQETRCAG